MFRDAAMANMCGFNGMILDTAIGGTTRIPRGWLHLLYAGKQLENSCTLSEDDFQRKVGLHSVLLQGSPKCSSEISGVVSNTQIVFDPGGPSERIYLICAMDAGTP